VLRLKLVGMISASEDSAEQSNGSSIKKAIFLRHLNRIEVTDLKLGDFLTFLVFISH
jgi:hypothetical protein